ncbi:hypothetical protein WQQ_02870 [Hydrocarboniphaga effusa AP103]|uniref:Uncharacterized protein n=1 Tax=Hydrocarboniphaga effusa AP103 TaxID=1172194 RepID=I8T8C3_9GAMM|nr:hypothetical protein WQQ_01000 [Hydrocarboniphaga effusa AP103]EIT70150.1 hypothetical protein WQQ_02870 [Hydrocarboniphaga effusa AP103]
MQHAVQTEDTCGDPAGPVLVPGHDSCAALTHKLLLTPRAMGEG